MELQWAGPEDAEEISRIAYDIYYEVYSYESREVVDDFLAHEQSPESIRSQMASGIRYAFIVCDGMRAGYAAYGMEDGGMHLSKLYVFEGFRGRGIGSAVMDIVEREAGANGADRIFLDVNRENAVAIGMYERRGFVATGYTGLRNRRMMMERILRGTGESGTKP